MPSISEFYGIKIYMYWNDSEFHNTPHIHAFYAEFQASFNLNGNLIAGKFPKTASKLVKTWILENHQELEYDWLLAKKQQPLIKIKGLN